MDRFETTSDGNWIQEVNIWSLGQSSYGETSQPPYHSADLVLHPRQKLLMKSTMSSTQLILK